MVNIVLCGPAGAGKHVLLDKLRQKVREVKNYRCITNVARRVLDYNHVQSRLDYQSNDDLYESVQRAIMNEQSVEEQAVTDDFITDNCVVNALAHISECLPSRDISDIVNQSVSDTLLRYKSSLVVLIGSVHHEHDDGICLKLKVDDWKEMKRTYVALFNTFEIPFIDIVSTDTVDRLDIVRRAMSGTINLHTSNLAFYDPKCKLEDQNLHGNFSFYIAPPVQKDGINVPTVKITEHAYEQKWTSFSKDMTNRFILKHGHDGLVCFEFHINVRSSVVQKMLLNGIQVNGENYTFLGCSANGLKLRKCYMIKGTIHDVQNILGQEGDFSCIKTVSKKMARIGLLFSAVKVTAIKIEPVNVLEQPDIISQGHNFSDGCGSLGKVLAREIFAQVNDAGNEETYLPSVFQMRFQGYKGVLQVDENVEENSIAVRPSMKKFETNHYPCIGICDYSRAYTFGHLNKQFIQLLSGLGVPDRVFEMKHDNHLERLSNMTTNAESAIKMLQWHNEFELAQIIVKAGNMEKIPDTFRSTVEQRLKSLKREMIQKLEKLRILIPDSRNVFGVCDTSDVLQYGECFIRVTMSGKLTTISGQVIVCKNPCYLLGDVRVLKAVDDLLNPGVRKLNHLKDCIVFPSKGQRPHCAEIAGSDLDGDQYFVSWDADLIPPKLRPPYSYPAAVSREQCEVTFDGMVSYFSKQNETQKLVGKIDKFYNVWADMKGVTCVECERLGQLFSRAIDAGKTGEELDIPRGLHPPETFEMQSANSNLYVWEKMKSKAMDCKEELTQKIMEKNEDVSDTFILEVAQTKFSNISEYEKFRFIVNHISSKVDSNEEVTMVFMNEYSPFVNFALFTTDEKREAIEMGVPLKHVLNALNKSTILSEEDLEQFSMDSPRNTWNEYLLSTHNDFDWRALIKALTMNDCTLLVLDMPDDIVIEVQFLKKQDIGVEIPVAPGTISAILYSKHFGYKFRYILGPTYVLDLTEDTLQLYRESKKNLTFVWLKATDRKKTKGKWNKRVSDEVVNSISVDLQRFHRRILDAGNRHPLVNKTPFIAMEVYTQSCKGELPYWDIYQANDILPILESVQEEIEQEEDLCPGTECLFPEDVFDGEILTQPSFIDAARHSAQAGNPYLFRSVLQIWNQGIPPEVLHHVVTLIENVLKKVASRPLTDSIQTVLLEVLSFFTDSLTDPAIILKVGGLLARLHMDDVANQIVTMDRQDMPCTMNEFLDALDRWSQLWYMDLAASKQFLRCLYLRIKDRNTRNGREDENHQSALQYVRRLAFLHAMSCLEEMALNRQQIKEEHCQRDATQMPIETQTCIMYLKLDTSAIQDDNTLSFYRTHSVDNKSQFVVGQYVAVSRQRDVKNMSYKAVCCIGQVKKIQNAPFTMTLHFDEDIPDSLMHCINASGVRYWRVDLLGNLATYTRVVTALRQVLDKYHSNDLLQCLVHGGNYQNAKCIGVDDYSDAVSKNSTGSLYTDRQFEDLNEEQRSAVNSSLSQHLTLIQGPPGTGKTTVACKIIEYILQAGKHTGILAVAETNTAVDNLARRLQNVCLITRIGSLEGVASDLYDVSLQGQVKILEEKEAKKAKFKDKYGDLQLNSKLISKVLNKADVVLATCAGAGDACLETCTFEFVLVDEATQTRETTLLCSLVHNPKQLVMIGDPKQLGPIVEFSNMDAMEADPDVPKLKELEETLFHRMYDVMPAVVLNVQHRMHPEIMAFPSTEFYDGKLKAAPNLKSRRPIVFPWPGCKKRYSMPLCFVNVDGKESRRGTSLCNIKEVAVVKKVVDVLLNVDENYREDRIAVDQISVITFYQGQCKTLKSALASSVLVSSVDGFQGQENDVVVVSTVRCNDRHVVGFAADPRRINVLLTRAKRGLIVVGNENTLKGCEIWKRWLRQSPKLHEDMIKPVSK